MLSAPSRVSKSRVRPKRSCSRSRHLRRPVLFRGTVSFGDVPSPYPSFSHPVCLPQASITIDLNFRYTE